MCQYLVASSGTIFQIDHCYRFGYCYLCGESAFPVRLETEPMGQHFADIESRGCRGGLADEGFLSNDLREQTPFGDTPMGDRLQTESHSIPVVRSGFEDVRLVMDIHGMTGAIDAEKNRVPRSLMQCSTTELKRQFSFEVKHAPKLKKHLNERARAKMRFKRKMNEDRDYEN